jgi:DNA polymerase beta
MVKKQLIIDEFKNLIKKLKHDIHIMESKKEDKKVINAVSFKIRNFIKVIKSLEAFDKEEITTSSEVKDLDGIGKGSLTRIDEIITTGIIKEGHEEVSDEDSEIAKRVEALMTITGIGPAKASELNKACITLEKLLDEYKKNKDNIEESSILKELTHHQIIGLKYYKQFMKKIPREKIDKIDVKIQKLLKKYLKTLENPLSMNAVICGSYRRGATESGDIDLLLSGDDKFDLIPFVKFLTDEGLITDHLTEKGTTKFMGVCDKTGGYRIDIRLVPIESYGAALMYFTGSKDFNTLVRAEALRQGYTLEEYGIYPLLREEEGGVKGSDNDSDKSMAVVKKKIAHSHQHMKGEKIPCPNEEVIFDILKLDKKFLNPTERNVDSSTNILAS